MDFTGIKTFDWKRNPNLTEQIAERMAPKLNLGDPTQANAALADNVAAIGNLGKQIKEKSTEVGDACPHCGRKGQTIESLAKTQSYVAKTTDEFYRLLNFAYGGPDSRTDNGLDELLALFSAEELQQFQDMVASARARTVNADLRTDNREAEV